MRNRFCRARQTARGSLFVLARSCGDGTIVGPPPSRTEASRKEARARYKGSDDMEFRDTENSVNDTVAEATIAAGTKAKPRKSGKDQDTHAVAPQLYPVEVDHSRDALLTDFGKETLKDRYLLPGETLSGSVRPRRLGLCRRCRARAAPLRLYLEAVVHARDAGSLERRHRARPADLAASSIRCPTASTASSTPGTRMSGSPRAAAASAPIGAMCAASASRSASTARPAASSRSSA